MTSRPTHPKESTPPSATADDDDAAKTVKLSVVELRQQLQELGVDVDVDLDANANANDDADVELPDDD